MLKQSRKLISIWNKSLYLQATLKSSCHENICTFHLIPNNYKYNEKGEYRELTNTANPDYEEQIDNASTYIYTKFDDKGNWIERNIEIVSVTSILDPMDNTAKKGASIKSYRVDKREITYF